MNLLHPGPEHKFAFGLWTIGHRGRDPFGDAVRPLIEPVEFVYRLGDLGGWGVSLHDDDLVPPETTLADRDLILDRFRKALDSTGMVVSMTTTNLFWHPAFKDGAFTASDRDVRRYALQKAMRSIDLGAELGAQTHVFWGGREGVEAVAAKPPLAALAHGDREALDFLCGYVHDRGYATRFALEPKPNEPRGDAVLPTVGHALAFIATLDQPDMVGLNPEVAHETMAGLERVPRGCPGDRRRQVVSHRPQRPAGHRSLRPGPPLRLGGVKDAFFVKLLEEPGYDGPRHFDCRLYRVEVSEGVVGLRSRCMRTYLALAARPDCFADDPEIQDALGECGAAALADATIGPCTSDAARAPPRRDVRPLPRCWPAALRQRTPADQLVIDLVSGPALAMARSAQGANSVETAPTPSARIGRRSRSGGGEDLSMTPPPCCRGRPCGASAPAGRRAADREKASPCTVYWSHGGGPVDGQPSGATGGSPPAGRRNSRREVGRDVERDLNLQATLGAEQVDPLIGLELRGTRERRLSPSEVEHRRRQHVRAERRVAVDGRRHACRAHHRRTTAPR